jgi:hypothetical protein
MANVRAFRSGAWSDTNPATSPWGTGGVLYAPAANDDVYSNTYTIHVDTNVTVTSVTNGSATSRLWKDGATTTATAGGTFNLLNGAVLTGNVNINVGQTPTSSSAVAVLSGTNAATIIGIVYGNIASGGGNITTVINSSSNILTIVGGVQAQNKSYAVAVASNTSSGVINITGNIIGGPSSRGLDNSSVGTIIVTGNITGGTGSAAYGINNSSTGTAIIVGNVVATSATNAFVSSNASAINKISGNIINNSNGTAAIYAASYRVDPVPTNSVIQYSNTNMFTTDSLSAFSMPPVSAVRSGVAFANSTLTGTCKVPSANSVNIGVPVDNAVGTAFLNPATLFDTSVASLTASDSLGARLKNSATVQSVGNIIASFSN